MNDSFDEKTITLGSTVDARGLKCPEPVMMLHNAVRDSKPGDVIKVIATDPSTQRDINKFCTFLNHHMLAEKREGEEYIFWVKKG
ncbi:tRNA 2-thiouridine synthesizing protein A [Alteromonadaceae bacterium Bs31]|nr:tRNA 2-thiouridine synthesizing protein A [Alteromonadaceae bacterium Bs31]